MSDLAGLAASIERGDRNAATALTLEAIDARLDPATILAAMTGAMDDVGARFKRHEIIMPSGPR